MPKHDRFADICIDIGERAVRIVKVNSTGVIVKAGASALSSSAYKTSDQAYPAVLASAIRRAADEAGIRGGRCTIVTGGPQIIARCIALPDMPAKALLANVENEIKAYLPAESEDYQVGHTILRRVTPQSESGSKAAALDVLAAAMSGEMSAALLAAVRSAGFAPERIDIRENARDKFMNLLTERLKLRTTESAPSFGNAYAIVDISDTLVNMTIFLNGVLYVNRYFGSHVLASVNADEAGDETAENPPAAGPIIDTDSLVTEIASILDYINYRERGSQVNCILLYGSEDNAPGLLQSLAAGVEIPVYQSEQLLPQIFGAGLGNKQKSAQLLDAYGAAFIPASRVGGELDLRRTKKKQRKPMGLLFPLISTVVVLGALFAAGIFFPTMHLASLNAQESKIDAELSQLAISEGDIFLLEQQINSGSLSLADAQRKLNEYFSFYNDYPPALTVLRTLTEALPPYTSILQLTVENGEVILRGITNDIGAVVNYVLALRERDIVVGEYAYFVSSAEDELLGVVVGFEIAILVGMGAGE